MFPSPDFVIRHELPSDYDEVENVVREAFWNVYCPGCSDHYLVHLMRDCPAFVPELDLVAVHKDRIGGHVVNLKSYIAGDDGNCYEVLSLGPIAVLPEYQRTGIGAALVAEVKKIAKNMGFRAILLCGNPAFYTKQGFIAAEQYGIRNSENMYADALHVCGLYEGALDGISGCYFEDEIYDVDEKAVKEFDTRFPYKEAVEGTPTQLHFLKMVQRCRPANIDADGLTHAQKGKEKMDKTMIAYCGSYCGACTWKDKVGCKGCKACAGNVFWGECDKAKCCISRGLEHCGECLDLPCEKLKDLFGDPEHGDRGVRLRNLQNWAAGNNTYEELGNVAQEQAKEL